MEIACGNVPELPGPVVIDLDVSGSMSSPITGLIGAPFGPLLKYHKALAAGVDAAVAIRRDVELEPILAVLGGICPIIHRMRPAAEARDRTAAEHFRDGQILQLPADQVLDFEGHREPLMRAQRSNRTAFAKLGAV